MKISKFLIILCLVFSTQNHAVADANGDIVEDKIKEVRDEIATESAKVMVDKLKELSTNAKEAAQLFKTQAINNLDKASASYKYDYEKYMLTYNDLINTSEKAAQTAEEIKKAANKGAVISKYMPVILTTLQAAYDGYKLYGESTSLQQEYPNFPLAASAIEYLGIVAEGGVSLIPYVGQAYTFLKAEQITFDEYDSMPTDDPARARAWVKDMAAKVEEYKKYGFPSGWKDGTSPPPPGILQYLKGANAFASREYGIASNDWITKWQLVASQTYSNGQIGYSVKWKESANCATSPQSYVCSPTLGNVISGITSGSNSHIGSANIYTGWGNNNSNAASTNPNNPNYTSNAQQQTGAQQSALVTNTQAFASTGWTLVEGNEATHIALGNSFGSITAPNGGAIASLNNASVQQTTMQRVFTIPTGVKQVTVGMLANFVTNEYPTFVGSQFNDRSIIEIKTGSGNVYQATLFNKELNSANFTLVNGLPTPLSSRGGQTGFEQVTKTINVANGGNLTITVKTINVGDTAVPSATLINSTSVK